MDTNLTEREGQCICTVRGDIDMYSSQELHSLWLAHAEKNRCKPFILNLQDTSYLDSSGIGVLVQILADAKRRQMPFCICGVHGMIEKLLKLGRMDAILPIEKDIKAALARTGAYKK